MLTCAGAFSSVDGLTTLVDDAEHYDERLTRELAVQVVDYYKDKLVHIKADQAQEAVADQIRKAVGS